MILLLTWQQLVTVTWSQKVKAELIDSKQTSKATVFFDGVDKESLYLDSDSSTKSITLGPFVEQMTVELTFYHKTGVGASWDISVVKTDKMKEVRFLSTQLIERLGIDFIILLPGWWPEDSGHFGMHPFHPGMTGPKANLMGLEF